MKRFGKMRLKGVHYFKDATFDFDQKGITLILGRNRNAGGNTNAAGKSFLMSQLPEMIHNVPLVGVRADRTREGSSVLQFKDAKHSYLFKRQFVKGSEKLQVVRDGKDMEFRELEAARQYMQSVIGFTPDEMSALVYMDMARGSHPLVAGDTPRRRKFFTEFFRLDSYDTLRSLLRAELNAITGNKAVYKELTARYSKLKEEYAPVEEGEIAAAQKQLDRAQRRMERAAEVSSSVEIYERYKDDLEPLLAKCDDDLLAYLAALKEKKAAAKQRVVQAREYADWRTEQKGVRKERKALESDHPWLLNQTDKPAVDRSALQQVEEAIETVENVHSEALGFLADYKRQLSAAQRALEKGDTCPECGQVVKELAKHVRELQRKEQVLKGKVEEQQAHCDKTAIRLHKMRVKRTAAQAEVEEQRERIAVWKRYRELQVTEFKGEVYDEDEERTKYEKITARIESASTYLPILEDYLRARRFTPEERGLAKQLSTLVAEHTDLSRRVTLLEAQQETASTAKAEIAALRGRIAELKESIEQEEAYRVLETAFSKKGVQTLLIRAICARLEKLVNKYARLLFPEDYSFTFDLGTHFSILVHRQHGKKEIVSDVRKLSGAESRLFPLLLMIALLNFVPAARRPNVLVMDEPDSTFSPQTMEAFLKFLPVLNKVVPHIVIITPRADNVPSADRIYTVVKEGQYSHLVEGAA